MRATSSIASGLVPFVVLLIGLMMLLAEHAREERPPARHGRTSAVAGAKPEHRTVAPAGEPELAADLRPTGGEPPARMDVPRSEDSIRSAGKPIADCRRRGARSEAQALDGNARAIGVEGKGCGRGSSHSRAGVADRVAC